MYFLYLLKFRSVSRFITRHVPIIRFQPGFSIFADFNRHSTARGLSIQAGIANSAVNPPVRLPKRANLARADSKAMVPGHFRVVPTSLPWPKSASPLPHGDTQPPLLQRG